MHREPPLFPPVCLKSRHEKLLDDPKPSFIVIINLIATLSFLYHKPSKPAVTRID